MKCDNMTFCIGKSPEIWFRKYYVCDIIITLYNVPTADYYNNNMFLR